MPELPEVETIVRMLRPLLCGRVLGAVRLCRRDMVRDGLSIAAWVSGRRVVAVERRAKRILIRLEGPATLGLHLGMTGQLSVAPATAPVRPHTHLIIDLAWRGRPAGQLRLRDVRRFGRIWWTPDHGLDDEELGPEPLTMTAAELAAALGRTRRAIKAALLDQRMVAGLGNIYADESLFVAGIHPRTPARRLSAEQCRRLWRAIRMVLRQAITHEGSSLRDYVMVNGQSGRYQNLHRVYGRAGLPCRRCGQPLHKCIVGGRTTCYCALCQARRASQPRRPTKRHE